MAPIGSGYRTHVTGLTHDQMGFPTSRPDEVNEFMNRLFRKIDNYYHDVLMFDEYLLEDADVAIVAYGCVARSAHYAVDLARERGYKVGLLTLKTLFPFARPAVEKLCMQCSQVVVPEMNMGQISREVKRVNNGKSRIRTLNRVDGQIITPSEILKAIS